MSSMTATTSARRLEDKTAVIFGAAGEVGGAVAEELAAQGARVFLSGRTKTRVQQLAQTISSHGGTATAAEVDALDEDAVTSYLDDVVAAAGRIDIMFNAMGPGPTVANAGHYARLVAECARRRRVIDIGIRLAHADADPAALAQLAGELADTTSGLDGRGWAPPIPFGGTGGVPVFPVETLPPWLGEYVAAVASATQTPPDLGRVSKAWGSRDMLRAWDEAT